MCGRYIIVSKIEKIEKRFGVSGGQLQAEFEPNHNVAPGDHVPVITQEKPDQIQLYRFGLRPFWSKKPMYLINARSEGDHNKENDVNYKGALGIKDKPSFRKPFRSQRCLIPANAFIEGTTKERLSKPYVVYPIEKNERPFAFAGIYDHYVDKETGEITSSFSILTSVSTPLLQKIPHHRSPVILDSPTAEQQWLNSELPIPTPKAPASK